MPKIRKALLATIFMMIGLAVPVILHIISDMNMNIRISREFYSNHAVAFWTADSDRTDIEYIMGHMEKGDILYGEIDRYCRGVYVKNGRSTFPVIWGRSFQKSDFFAGKKVALIGRNRRNDCQTIDGKAYYAVQGELYEVIGILGIESPSLLDNYLWINLDAMLDFFQSDGFYVLDGGRKSGKLLQDTSLGDIIREADIEKMGVRAMYKGRSTGLAIFVLVLLCLLICAVISISFWLENQKYPLSVKRLCGVSDFNILLDILKEFTLTCSLGYLIGSAAAILLLKNRYSRLDVLYALSASIMLIPLSIAPAILYLKNWTNRYLR